MHTLGRARGGYTERHEERERVFLLEGRWAPVKEIKLWKGRRWTS